MEKYSATELIPFAYDIVGIFGKYAVLKGKYHKGEYIVVPTNDNKDVTYEPYSDIKCQAFRNGSNISYLLFCQRSEEMALDSVDLVNKEILDIYDTSKERALITGKDRALIGSYIIMNAYDQGNKKVLKSLKTGKYHILDYSRDNITLNDQSQSLEKFYEFFNEEYDDYKIVYSSPSNLGIILSKNGKYDFYYGQDLSDLTFEYDAIEICNNPIDKEHIDTLILKKGKQEYILNNNLGNYWIKVDKPYERIEDIGNNYFACYSNDQIDLIKGHELLFTTSADKRIVKSLISENTENRTLYFAYEKDGKLGLLCKTGKKVKILTKPLYDDIRYDANLELFVLKQEDKTSIFDGYGKVTSLDCDNISFLSDIGGNLYVLLHHQDRADIYDLTNSKTLKKDINAVNKRFYLGAGLGIKFIYNSDNKYGIFSIILDDSNKKPVISLKDTGPIYDNIETLNDYTYIITKDGKQGLFEKGEVIVEPKYQSITTKYFPRKAGMVFSFRQLFIAKKFNSEVDDLFWIERTLENGGIKPKLHFFNYPSLTYQTKLSIDFVDELIVLHVNDCDDKYTNIYSFDEDFTFLGNYGVDVKLVPINSSEVVLTDRGKIHLYNASWTSEGEEKNCTLAYIEDSNPSLKKLAVIPSFNKQLFITAYDFSEGTIVINSENETEHLKKCRSIESLDEDKINATLKKMNEKVLIKERK